MRMLFLDRDKQRRDALSARVCETLQGPSLTTCAMTQSDVFESPPGGDCLAVFIWVGGILDMEAARQLSRAAPEVPVVIYSDSEDYGLESYNVNACYYLMYPIGDEALVNALTRCGLINGI